jgi:hypothetical protein
LIIDSRLVGPTRFRNRSSSTFVVHRGGRPRGFFFTIFPALKVWPVRTRATAPFAIFLRLVLLNLRRRRLRYPAAGPAVHDHGDVGVAELALREDLRRELLVLRDLQHRRGHRELGLAEKRHGQPAWREVSSLATRVRMAWRTAVRWLSPPVATEAVPGSAAAAALRARIRVHATHFAGGTKQQQRNSTRRAHRAAEEQRGNTTRARSGPAPRFARGLRQKHHAPRTARGA